MATGVNNAFKPSRLEIEVNSPQAAKSWKHWKKTFENYVAEHAAAENAPALNKLRLLTNFISADIFEFIEDCTTYDTALKALEDLFVKKPNQIFSRHLLATRKQQHGESLREFMQALEVLSKDCQCKAVSAENYRKELCRDAFINGLQSQMIRQRLLENDTLDLKTAFDQASALDVAHRNSLAYDPALTAVAHSRELPTQKQPDILSTPGSHQQVNIAAFSKSRKCYFCGYDYHDRSQCPARESTCNHCGKPGHFMRVCKSKRRNQQVAAAMSGESQLCSLRSPSPHGLRSATIPITIMGTEICALIDSGSTDNYIKASVAKSLQLEILPTNKEISMAQTSLSCIIRGVCTTNIIIDHHEYKSVAFGIMDNLCTDAILGQAYQRRHNRVVIEYGGRQKDLVLPKSVSGALPAALVPPETLFPNLLKSCKPIAVKSRRYCEADKTFIASEIAKLLEDDVIETSRSPWRAQIVIVRNDRKTRMCIDYSQTINLYTELDAYPFPRIDAMVNQLAKYAVFSKYDLKSAYHQIPILPSDRKYTAFEANGRLWQYKRIPFGVTNGGINFQRAINRVIEEEKLKDVFAYQDDVTICGRNQDEHDHNVKAFVEAFRRRKLSFNENKTIQSVTHISVLGYRIEHSLIRPDPERLMPLREFPLPQNKKALQRVLGMLAYYAKWIQNFSEKAKPLMTAESFPLNDEARRVFENLKDELARVSLQSIDETLPFVVECDASDTTISATLNQGDRPVAFLSRMLRGAELHYPAVEKEATAIIEATRKWRDLLLRKHFTVITDQRSVAFMMDNRRRTKIKNNKILIWRMELASLSYSLPFDTDQER